MPGSTQPCMPRGDDDNDIYEDTTASTPTNAPCDYEYMCSTSVAREIQQQADVTAVPPPGAQMVTGVSRKQETKQGKPGTKLERPAVFPKPSKGETVLVTIYRCVRIMQCFLHRSNLWYQSLSLSYTTTTWYTILI